MDNIKQSVEQLTEQEFREFLRWITADERKRRTTVVAVTERENEIATEYHQSQGDEIVTEIPSDPTTISAPNWRQPFGAHDAWPINAIIFHNDKYWRNIAGVPNVWEPGNDGPVPTWQEITIADAEPEPEVPEEPTDPEVPVDPEPEPEPEPTIPEWQSGVAYVVGEVVDYQGVKYRIVQPHTSQADWTPDAVPALYAQVVN